MPWRAQFRIHTRQRGPCLISPHLCDSRTFASDTFFDIEPQKRSRLTKLGAQTQHRVIQQFVPPSTSKQSEITCSRDKCVVFHNIGQAISGSTVHRTCMFLPTTQPKHANIGVTQYSKYLHDQYSTRQYFQHAHFIPIAGVGKERCILIGPW